jgi:predicted transposase YbfD/YdcC
MDHSQFTQFDPLRNTLIDSLQHVPDPRQARGKQFEWLFLLGTITAALLCEQRSPRAIAQWASSHAAALLAAFRPRSGRVPSEATLLRTLRHLDVDALEHILADFIHSLSAPPSSPHIVPTLQGQAVDGKAIRGAQAHGKRTHLVSLVQHDSAEVLAQLAVEAKRNEISAVPQLLDGRSLQGKVFTMDALLTQRKLAEQVLAQHGHYLMVAKANQRQLSEELSWFFRTPPLACDEPWREDVRVTKGHGRLETRRVTCTSELDGYLSWPGVQQVVRRECERIKVKTGEVTRTVTYGLTSLRAEEASAAAIAKLWRGHWTIENRVHYVRDVTMGEDGGQVHTGDGPQVLAALRNALLALLRKKGWKNIADGLRHYHEHLAQALALIGARPVLTLT